MIFLDGKQIKTAANKIKQFYKLSREVTDREVIEEIYDLVRRNANNNLDDNQEKLFSILSVGENPIELN